MKTTITEKTTRVCIGHKTKMSRLDKLTLLGEFCWAELTRHFVWGLVFGEGKTPGRDWRRKKRDCNRPKSKPKSKILISEKKKEWRVCRNGGLAVVVLCWNRPFHFKAHGGATPNWLRRRLYHQKQRKPLFPQKRSFQWARESASPSPISSNNSTRKSPIPSSKSASTMAFPPNTFPGILLLLFKSIIW